MPDLGAYAVTVLSAYAVSLAALALLILAYWRAAKRSKKALEQAESAQK